MEITNIPGDLKPVILYKTINVFMIAWDKTYVYHVL